MEIIMNIKVLNLQSLAKMLCCSKSTIYRYVKERKISYIKRGRVLLFSESDVEEFLNRHKVLGKED